jgi:hypothetical protein
VRGTPRRASLSCDERRALLRVPLPALASAARAADAQLPTAAARDAFSFEHELERALKWRRTKRTWRCWHAVVRDGDPAQDSATRPAARVEGSAPRLRTALDARFALQPGSPDCARCRKQLQGVAFRVDAIAAGGAPVAGLLCSTCARELRDDTALLAAPVGGVSLLPRGGGRRHGAAGEEAERELAAHFAPLLAQLARRDGDAAAAAAAGALRPKEEAAHALQTGARSLVSAAHACCVRSVSVLF